MRAMPSFPSMVISMTSMPHELVSWRLFVPSLSITHTLATPLWSEMKKIWSGNAGEVTGDHAPRLLHDSGVNKVASSSPSHHRHSRLCSPPS